MALIEYDAYKQKLRELKPELDKLSAALDIESARQEAARLEDETAQDGFWNDLERSQKVQQRLKQLQNKITRQEKLLSAWEDLTALCEMGQEADDAEILEELKAPGGKDTIPTLTVALLQSVLQNSRYPEELLYCTIRRIRAEHKLS